MLRRSSVFAAEVMEVFDRSPTDKELVSQSKMLCRDYIHSRLNRTGIGWTKAELGSTAGTLAEVSTVLLWLGKTHSRNTLLFCLMLRLIKKSEMAQKHSATDLKMICSSTSCLIGTSVQPVPLTGRQNQAGVFLSLQ